MRLAVFDLDQTLLSSDSDYLWGKFLIDQGVVDAEAHARENDRFFRDYQAGTLNIHDYVAFVVAPMLENPLAKMQALLKQYVDERIEPLIARGSRALLAQHRAQGDTLLITTATNRFVVEPIAALLGVDNLIATDLEIVDGQYTGKIAGTPNFQHGKVTRLQAWIAAQNQPVTVTCAYSDSHNDLPLLSLAERPVAVDPDPTLRAEARARGWDIISLR